MSESTKLTPSGQSFTTTQAAFVAGLATSLIVVGLGQQNGDSYSRSPAWLFGLGAIYAVFALAIWLASRYRMVRRAR